MPPSKTHAFGMVFAVAAVYGPPGAEGILVLIIT